MDEPFASLSGSLLVAVPALTDPHFCRTVVLVVEHSADGAMGLVLNRPTELQVSDVVDQLAGLVGPGDVVHYGGPVQPDAVLALAEFEDVSLAAAPAIGDVGFVGTDPDGDLVAPTTRRARVFAGYSGWAPGQLESELEESAWVIVDGVPDDVFTDDPDDLWRAVLRRKGGVAALLSLAPEDPTAN